MRCHPEEAKPTKDLAPGARLDFHIAAGTSAALRLRHRGGYHEAPAQSLLLEEKVPQCAHWGG